MRRRRPPQRARRRGTWPPTRRSGGSASRQKQEELRQVAAEHAALRGYVTFCNDGHTVFTRDAAGVKERIPCSQLHARLTALDSQAAELRNYLEHELPEECRRAGCLPGWIR
jgi:hypothetical protein